MSPRRLLLVVAALAISIGAGRAAGTTFGAFSATTSNTSTMSAKAVFPAVRAWSAWDLRDASGGGAEVNASTAARRTASLSCERLSTRTRRGASPRAPRSQRRAHARNGASPRVATAQRASTE